MLVHISSKTFDLSGTLTVKASLRTPLGGMTRRVNRVATLDGGVAVNDRGFAHGDRTFSVSYKPTSAAENAIARRIMANHSRVILSIPEGCFEAAPEAFEEGADENRFSFLVVEKLSGED